MNSIKNKLFPFALIVVLSIGIVGLSSWRAPQTKKDPSDTTKKSSKKEAKSSKTTIITFDENGNPHEEVIENFSGDEELKEMLLDDSHFSFDFPPIPDFDIAIPDIPEIQFDFKPENFEGFNFDEEFENRLQDNLEAIEPEMLARMEAMSKKLSEMDMRFNDELQLGLNEKMKLLDEQMRTLDMNLNEHLIPMNFNLDKLKRLEELSQGYTQRLKEFEEEARKELIKDGYMKEGETIDSMSFSDDTIEFNGKTIKKEHEKKYRALEDRYFTKSNLGRIE